MTRIDKIRQAAQNYSDSMDEFQRYHTYPRSAFIDGAKWADKTMIDKACRWLDHQLFIKYDSDAVTRFINNFRKAMEEE